MRLKNQGGGLLLAAALTTFTLPAFAQDMPDLPAPPPPAGDSPMAMPETGMPMPPAPDGFDMSMPSAADAAPASPDLGSSDLPIGSDMNFGSQSKSPAMPDMNKSVSDLMSGMNNGDNSNLMGGGDNTQQLMQKLPQSLKNIQQYQQKINELINTQ